MAKSSRKSLDKASAHKSTAKSFIRVDEKKIDSNLSSLFATSLGPVAPPPKSRYQEAKQQKQAAEESDEEDEEENEEDDEVLSSGSEELDSEDDAEDAMEVDEDSEAESSADADEEDESESEKAESEPLAQAPEAEQPNKKRKRGPKEDEVEDVYMRKLAREELKEEEARKKKQKTDTPAAAAASASDSDSDEADFAIPKHETQDAGTTNASELELEKAARTVFLGNVSSDAITSKTAKKTLLRHLGSFLPDLADTKPAHKVESLRFRSTAFTGALPKKAAFAKKEILDATTKSTHAYAVYTTPLAAREAAKRLNGTVVLGRHLRVDSLAHPAQTDHRRCVFVGGLSFVDDETPATATNEDGTEKKKSKKPPADIEEGLWVQFSKAGKVENVRVVRDAKTRVGKGIAYVQFADENGVEAALLFNGEKYPPLLPRKLRVTRARAQKAKPKSQPKPHGQRPVASGPNAMAKGAYTAKITPEQKTMQGRAQAMLGKAGVSKAKEAFVFEGHRASSKQGNSGLKLGGKSKKKGKPSNRSVKRAAAWQKAGGKSQFGK